MASPRLIGGYARGTVDEIAHWHTFRVPGRHVGEGGFTVGLDPYGVPRSFDHVVLRLLHLIDAGSVALTGDVGVGKTTLAQRFASLAWMMRYRGGKRARMAVDITKAGDYADWVKALGGTVVDLNAAYRDGINILDPELPLTTQDHLKNLALFMRDDGGKKLRPDQKSMLASALVAVVEEKQLDEPHIIKLNDWLNTVTYDEYARLLHNMNILSVEIMPRISDDAVQGIARSLSFRIANIINGEYGKILGGHGSLARRIKELIVCFDYTKLDPEAAPIVQAFMWQVKAAGLRSSNDDFFTDIEIYDENYEYWENYALAKTLRSNIKKLRSTGKLLFVVSQHYSDYLAIGGKQGKLAENMLHDIGSHIAGRHDDVVNAKLIRKYGGFTHAESASVPYLDNGSFLAKIGNQPAFPFDSPHLEFMRKASDTDRASRKNLEAFT